LVPAGRTTELLIRLALDAGVPVRVERLIENLWGPEGLQTPRNTMQPKVSKLRRALGDPSLVTSSSGGYALAVNRGTVDAFAAVELRPVDESARRQQRAVHYKGQAGFDHVDPVPVHCGRPLPGGLPAVRGGLRASRAWSR
jgi:DNA-binding SARP family transcriptional activator